MRSLGKDSHDPRYILPATAVVIDWSGAVLKPKGRDLELAVRLSRRPTACGRRSSRASAHDRRPRVQAAYARQQAVKAQEESAKQMTERFRSPS